MKKKNEKYHGRSIRPASHDSSKMNICARRHLTTFRQKIVMQFQARPFCLSASDAKKCANFFLRDMRKTA